MSGAKNTELHLKKQSKCENEWALCVHMHAGICYKQKTAFYEYLNTVFQFEKELQNKFPLLRGGGPLPTKWSTFLLGSLY